MKDTPDGKRELLAYLLKQHGFNSPRRILPRRSGGPAPVSFAQQRMWFLQQLDPESPAYNLPCVVRLTGPLDVSILERTLCEIVRRHEALRTSFQFSDVQLVQVIHPAQPASIEVMDLREEPEPTRPALVSKLALAHARRPFDLARGPLYRASLLRLGTDEYVVLFALHHIASDGWSTGILMREVAVLYESYSRGLESPLPELPIQYADYAVWQRGWLSGKTLEDQLAYWRRKLSNAPATLELSGARPRPPVRRHNGAVHIIRISREVASALKRFSREEGATFFMTLLAAFKVLLYHCSGQIDITVGTPVAGRYHPDIEQLIGCFVNTLVIRTDLSGEPTFRDLVRRVREACLGAYTHQDLPFERLVEELQPERDLGRTPLFQVTFTLQQQSVTKKLELSRLSLAPMSGERGTTQYDMSVNLLEIEQGVAGPLEYDTDLFDSGTIAFWVLCYESILSVVANQPEIKLSALAAHADEIEKQQHRFCARDYEEFCRSKLAGLKRKGARAGFMNVARTQSNTLANSQSDLHP